MYASLDKDNSSPESTLTSTESMTSISNTSPAFPIEDAGSYRSIVFRFPAKVKGMHPRRTKRMLGFVYKMID